MKIATLSVDRPLIPGKKTLLRDRETMVLIDEFSLMSNDEDQDQTEMGNQERKEKKVKLTAKDEGQVIRARAFLNRLDKKVDEKDEHVKQVR